MSDATFPPMQALADVPGPNDEKLRFEALRLASGLGYAHEGQVLEAAHCYLVFLKGK